MDTTKRKDELIKLIQHHNTCYWEKGESEISDIEYDELVRQLEAIDPTHPLIHKIHAPKVSSTGKVVHTQPMLSLNKAYSLNELLEWANKYARNMDEVFLIQPKYDGISANYAGGILATRGDGTEGENITDKIELIELETTGYKGPLDRPVRGEIIIRNDDFEKIYSKIKRKDGKPYKNSRNAVAGIMGLKDITGIKNQGAKLTLIDYDMISYSVTLREFALKWESILEEIENLPYPMDGIVIKFANTEFGEQLGNTAHHPRSQIAYKFTNIKRESTLIDVEWSFGKNCITPVALIEPVEINGVTIQRATLHNAQNILDKDIQIGDKVIVERAGDVIPYITSSTPGVTRSSALITHCPCCKHELERRGPELCCPNTNCKETRLQRLLAAVKSIGIDRLGEPNIRKMMDTLNVKTLKDIFNLTIDDILSLDGFKEKSATNLYNEIQRARDVNDYQVLTALNIPTVGINVSKAILKEYTIAELRELDEEKLSALNGVGPERAQAIERELTLQSYFLDELLNCVNLIQTKGNDIDVKPTICFTGKMPEKRSYYETIAKERGFEPVNTINSSLSVLVALNPNGTSSKIKKAAKAGIKIKGLDEWLNETEAVDEKTNKISTEQSPEPENIAKLTQNNEIEEHSTTQTTGAVPPQHKTQIEDDLFSSMDQGSFDF